MDEPASALDPISTAKIEELIYELKRSYTIVIANLGAETVQLKTRHWRITDALGRLQEVKGPGVVGEEPRLKPGESFEYTSGVPLPTPSGFMTGSYGMVTGGGEHFDIEIPAFSLDSPSSERTLN